MLADYVTHALPEIFFIFLLNDENYLLKSCPDSIIHGKVNNLVTLIVYRVNLLQSAVAASHSCCQNYQYRFIHILLPFCVL